VNGLLRGAVCGMWPINENVAATPVNSAVRVAVSGIHLRPRPTKADSTKSAPIATIANTSHLPSVAAANRRTPVKLEKVEVRDFRGIEHLSLEFCDELGRIQ